MSVSYRPTPEQLAAARTSAARGGRIAYDALDFGVAAKNTYGQGGWGVAHNGSLAVEKYKQLKADAGFKTDTWEEGVFNKAADVANVSGMVISAVALPKMAQQTVTSFKELSTAIHDPTATNDTRLNALEQTARAGAGTVYSAQGVVVGAKATVGILARNRGIANVVTKVDESPFTKLFSSPVGKVFNVLMPVADGAVFIGELIATRRVLEDKTATPGAKIRELLNLGLATLKVSFWLLPGVAALREAYAIANFVQLGLSLWDFQKTMAPHFKNAAKTAVWAIGHPVDALKGLANATVSGVEKVAHAVAVTAGWLFDKVAHPVKAWDDLKSETSTWYNAYLVARGKQLVSAWWPGANQGASPVGSPQAPGQQAQALLAYAPQAAPAAAAPLQGAGAVQAAPAAPAVPPPLPAPVPPAPAAPAPPAPVVAAAPAPVAAAPAPVAAPAAAPALPGVAPASAGPVIAAAQSAQPAAIGAGVPDSVQQAYQQAMAAINQIGKA